MVEQVELQVSQASDRMGCNQRGLWELAAADGRLGALMKQIRCPSPSPPCSGQANCLTRLTIRSMQFQSQVQYMQLQQCSPKCLTFQDNPPAPYLGQAPAPPLCQSDPLKVFPGWMESSVKEAEDNERGAEDLVNPKNQQKTDQAQTQLEITNLVQLWPLDSEWCRFLWNQQACVQTLFNLCLILLQNMLRWNSSRLWIKTRD